MTDVIFNYNYTYNVINEEWIFQDTVTNKAPNGKFPVGKNTVKLRVQRDNGKWSNWTDVSFNVNEYTEKVMNNNGSTLILIEKYEVGDNLIFNYTNNSNLNWIVPISGLYRLDSSGAGAGGKGARVQGDILLTQGDIVNFKIHQKNNGGGSGGSGGSGGTIIKLNNNIVTAAGGAGKKGTGYDRSGNSGAGGIGGDGGYESGGPGGAGESSSYYDSFRRQNWVGSGGQGGRATSAGGGGGTQRKSVGSTPYIYHSAGSKGPTLYDGGGGGNTDGSAYSPGGGGGGGAGGMSFVDTDSVKSSAVTTGYNAGNGIIKFTLVNRK